MSGFAEQNIRDGLDQGFPSSLTPDSPNCALASAGGRCTYVSKQLTNNGATHQNLFTVTGLVRIQEIYAVATAVSDSTTFSGVDFDVYDGTTATVLTTATDCSGIAVKDGIAKTADDGTGLTFLDGSAAAYYENATQNKAFGEGLAIESSAGTTYIRLGYTGDGSTDITLTFYCRYEPCSSGAAVTAA